MKLMIYFSDEQDKYRISNKFELLLRRAIEATLEHEKVGGGCEVSLTFTDNAAIIGSSVRNVSAVLTTSPDRTAAATDLSASSEPVVGVYNLMVVSVDTRYIDNEPDRNYVVAVGGNSMNTAKYIGSKSYANRDIMFSLMKTFSRVTVPADINFKVFEDTKLDITQAEAYRYTFLYTVIPALIVAGIGVYVYVRRKTL